MQFKSDLQPMMKTYINILKLNNKIKIYIRVSEIEGAQLTLKSIA